MKPLSCVLLLPLAVTVPGVHAEVLLDNLDQPVRNPAHIVDGFWSAQSFITPGGDALWLDSVTLRLGERLGNPEIRAELRADSAGGGPGSLLTGLAVPALSAGPTQNELLLPATGVALLPGSTYWLVLGVNGAGGFDWSYAQGNGASGSGSFGDYAYSVSQGAVWTGFGLEDPYMARIEVSAVPELQPATLLAVGLVVLRWLRQRRPAQA